MITNHSLVGFARVNDFLNFLHSELERRKEINHRYSLRAFAKHLEVSPGILSRYLNGKRGFTPEAIDHLGSRLNLSPEEVLQYQKQQKVKKDQVLDFTQLDNDKFNVLSEWYYGTIMQLPLLKNYKNDIDWISKTLGLKKSVVKEALKALDRLELIKLAPKTFKWKRLVKRSYIINKNR